MSISKSSLVDLLAFVIGIVIFTVSVGYLFKLVVRMDAEGIVIELACECPCGEEVSDDTE